MPAGTLGLVIVVAAVAVIAGAGLCEFDASHAVESHLCLFFLGTTIGLLLASPLAPASQRVPALVKAYHRDPSDLPAPPPKA